MLTHGEIIGSAYGEIEAYGFGEIKSTHRRSDFTCEADFTRAERGYHPPARVDLVEKEKTRLERVFSFSGGVTQI